MRKGKTSPSPSQGGGANLLPLGEIREGFLCLLFGLLLVGCQSRQQQSHEVVSDFDSQQEEAALRTMLDEVYQEVNLRWDNDSEVNCYANSMEELYTTKEYQQMYDTLHAIEVQKFEQGQADEAFFAVGGNVWTMGSHNLPFSTKVVRVEFPNDSTADLYFFLKPAEGDSIPILWQLKKISDQWLIRNFIVGGGYYEYNYDYMSSMRDYIKRNQ